MCQLKGNWAGIKMSPMSAKWSGSTCIPMLADLLEQVHGQAEGPLMAVFGQIQPALSSESTYKNPSMAVEEVYGTAQQFNKTIEQRVI